MVTLPNNFTYSLCLVIPVFRITLVLFLLLNLSTAFGQKVGINTETPLAGLHVEHELGILATAEFGTGYVQTSGYGTRMMWIPKIASFRVGRLSDEDGGIYETWWDFANSGDYSFVSGLNSKAKGYASFATGNKNAAEANWSAAVGGQFNTALGNRSFVTGYNNTAYSLGEFVVGMFAETYTPFSSTDYYSTDRIFVVGNGAHAGARTNAMTILKNGFTGIGTVSPLSKLHVSGGVRMDSVQTGYFILTGSPVNGYVLMSDASGKGTWTAPSALFSDDWNLNGEDIYNTNAERVGIGTSTPQEKLHIAGNTMIDGTLQTTNFRMTSGGGANKLLLSDENGNGIWANPSSVISDDWNLTGENLYNTNAANVGIGTNDPQQKLHIAGNAIVDGNFRSAYFQMTNGGGADLILESDANGNGTWVTPSTVFSDDWNLNGENLHNTNAENVGIGTGNPQQKLHVAGNAIIDGNFRSSNFQMTNSGGVGKLLQSDMDGNASWVDLNVISPWTISGSDIYNNNTNYIGIGTSAPTEKIELLGNLKMNAGRIIFSNTGFGTFVGQDAGLNDVAADLNVSTFIGKNAGKSNTTGGENTALGGDALTDNITGGHNVALGNASMNSNVSGAANTAVGYGSLGNNMSGNGNVALGFFALANNNSSYNIGLGDTAGNDNVTGSFNTFVGRSSGRTNLGSGNVFLGYSSGESETGSNKLYISNSSTSNPLIYGDFSSKHLTIYDSLTSEIMRIDSGRLSFINTGQSVFIGKDAGLADDLNNNNSVFIGHQAGKSNTEGNNNIAIGAFALDDASVSNYNIAVGQDVLGVGGMTGNYNTGIGNFSLSANSSGGDNIALGQNTLSSNTLGTRNIAIGNYSIDANTTGSYNTVMGHEAQGESISGDLNTSFGFYAGHNNNGSNNTHIGAQSGLTNTSGSGNVFLGNEAGFSETGSNKLYISNTSTSTPLIYGDFNTKHLTINDSMTAKIIRLNGNLKMNAGRIIFTNSGYGTFVGEDAGLNDVAAGLHANTFIGRNAGKSNTTGSENTAVGANALMNNISGNSNIAIGNGASNNNVTGNANTSIGYNALASNTASTHNVALGYYALGDNTGSANVALGSQAGNGNVSGSNNTFIGKFAGKDNLGSNNVFLGHTAGETETGSNKLYIDNSNTTSPLIHGDFSTNEVTINDSLTVGKELGVATSTPKSTFEVNGSVAAKFKTPLVAGTTNPDDTGMVWRYNSGTGTITLPAANTCANRMYVIINHTGTTRTISQYHDLGAVNQTSIATSTSLWLMSDGSEWWQIK